MRRWLSIGILLVCVLGVAGCSSLIGQETTPSATLTPASVPSPSPTPAPPAEPYFVFNNKWNFSNHYDVTVYLADGPIPAYRVTLPNGRTVVVEEDHRIPFNATHIEPTNQILAQQTYTVQPRSALFVALRNCSANTSVMYAVEKLNTSGWTWDSGSACHGYTTLVEIGPHESMGASGGDYTHVTFNERTTVRTLAVPETSTSDDG